MNDSKIEAALDAAESDMQQAMKSSDVVALDRMISDDLVFTGIDGAAISKEDDLEAHRSGATHFERLDEVSRIVHASDGRNFTEVVADVATSAEGATRVARLKWHRDWEFIDGRWQVVKGSVALA
ncbi:MAG: nuclear transport factor 2 family protein [Bifidobacterium psychraerophilum]|jgi:hypothetical protein|uniref:nuclear transport factor 2 family protein n=1 Tax=Bifidobacterium psychraerophilum TaxID=218140 RepID=UPI0039E7E984